MPHPTTIAQVAHQARVERLTRLADQERAQQQAGRRRSRSLAAHFGAVARTAASWLHGGVTRDPVTSDIVPDPIGISVDAAT